MSTISAIALSELKKKAVVENKNVKNSRNIRSSNTNETGKK